MTMQTGIDTYGAVSIMPPFATICGAAGLALLRLQDRAIQALAAGLVTRGYLRSAWRGKGRRSRIPGLDASDTRSQCSHIQC
jgi:hypothetical protein